MVVLWCSKPKGSPALLRWFQSGRNRLGRLKKVWSVSKLHGSVMVKAVLFEGQGGENRFPVGPLAHLSCFKSVTKGLGRV